MPARNAAPDFAVAFIFAFSSQATDLSNNLYATTGGTEAATPTRLLAFSFSTGDSSHTLNSVSLILSATAGSAATVQLYSDNNYEPGTLLATLNSPASFPTTPQATTFATGGIALAANTTYWLMLVPTAGTFSWSWAATSTGSGAGFTHIWSVSDDLATDWWSQDIYPLQAAITVDVPCSADFNGDGFVDFFDFTDFVTCFEGERCPSSKTADINNDDFVDFFDFNAFVDVFEAGC